MSIEGVRFRAEGVLVVLQVLDGDAGDDYYVHSRRSKTWRDAKVEDLLDASGFFNIWPKKITVSHMTENEP